MKVQAKKEWNTPSLTKHTRESVDILNGTKAISEVGPDSLGSQ